MKKIGLLSDTHGYLDPGLNEFFRDCDEIWHAGDIGDIETARKLEAMKPLRAVYGNVDGQDVRLEYPKHQRFNCEKVAVWITHIGGYPGKFKKSIREEIRKDPPALFIAGHSHILKVQYDKELRFLYINPGSAGNTGTHQVKTAVRFVIDEEEIKELEIIELGKRL